MPGRWNSTQTPYKLKVFRIKISRKYQKGHCMWVPQKNKPHMLIHRFFLIKSCMVLKLKILFVVLKELNSQSYWSCFNDFMTFYLQFFVSKIRFTVIWILSWNNLNLAREMFDVFCWQLYEMNPQNCRRKRLGDEVTENWHQVQDMNNELGCGSNY